MGPTNQQLRVKETFLCQSEPLKTDKDSEVQRMYTSEQTISRMYKNALMISKATVSTAADLNTDNHESFQQQNGVLERHSTFNQSYSLCSCVHCQQICSSRATGV